LERNEEKIVGMMSGEASEKTDKWMESRFSSESKWNTNIIQRHNVLPFAHHCMQKQKDLFLFV
jgi:hypothetical protein